MRERDTDRRGVGVVDGEEERKDKGRTHWRERRRERETERKRRFSGCSWRRENTGRNGFRYGRLGGAN